MMTSATDARLELQGVSCGYPGRVVLEDVSFSVPAGSVCCIVGPNGVGKTTLFRTILGSLPAKGGRVLVDGLDAATLDRREMAQHVGYVPQAHTPPFPFSVTDVVAMGRTAHLSVVASPSSADRRLALESLNRLGIAHLHDRVYTQISGGERQLVLIARALCQQAGVLVMDEPTASLDFGNQVRVLSCVKELAAEGYAVVMTTHAPDQAFMCSSQVVMLRRSGEVRTGSANELLDEDSMRALYGVDAQIVDVETKAGGVRMCVPVDLL